MLHLISPLAISDGPVASGVCKAIAHEFRGLWSNAGQVDALEGLANQIASKGFWREGWIAVRQTRIYDGEHMPADIRKRLTALEESLRPKDLVDKVKGVVLGSGRSVDLDDLDEVENDDYEGAMVRMNQTVESLGRDVANDDEAFKTLLLSLVRGGSRVPLFGVGLGSSTEKPYEIWHALKTEFSASDKPDTGLMGGFLLGLQKLDAVLADKMLDEAVEHPSVGVYFPHLQARIVVDKNGLKRLHLALELGKADITQYFALAHGLASDDIPGPEFRDLLLAIAKKPGGLTVALEILSMRLFANGMDKKEPVPEAAEAGRVLLDAFEFHAKDARSDREDRELGSIVKVSLAGEEGIPIVRRIVRKLMIAVGRYDIHAYAQDDLVMGLLHVHPSVVLDEAFSGDEKARAKAVQAFVDFQRFRKNPVGVVPDDVLLGWCDVDPAVRYPLMAASAGLFKRPANNEPHEWLPLASKLLTKAPDPHAILKEIVRRLRPWSWSGSLATQLEGRLKLLEQLPAGHGPQIADGLNKAKSDFQEWIAKERRNEAAESRERDSRFED
ncbi:hypothetical protein [Bradyrhizobium glycinis]|uniref:hypothetical protein n=1 Tax=Bradyrhizobium glycinis TaxID=2751812 RepID=UPI0018D94C84|nr:hypothetical protein [Bradyrhizobium glycinis]MBH5373518.1 hypothetical protein [Bradyrhizobium glycinis]